MADLSEKGITQSAAAEYASSRILRATVLLLAALRQQMRCEKLLRADRTDIVSAGIMSNHLYSAIEAANADRESFDQTCRWQTFVLWRSVFVAEKP
jgi:hypothetical protein